MSLLDAMKTCQALIHKWTCIVSTSNRMLSRLSNNNISFALTLWRQLKLKFINSLNVASFKRNSTQTRSLTFYLYSRRTEKSGSASTFVISTQPILRNLLCPSLTSWLTTHVASKGCPLWMTSLGTNKSRRTRMTKSIHHFEPRWEYIAVWWFYLN